MSKLSKTRQIGLFLFLLIGLISLITLSTKLYSQIPSVITVSVGNEPRGGAFNPYTGRAVITNHNANTVSVFNATTFSVTNVRVGSHPYGVAINTSNNKAYVVNEQSDTVSVVDLNTNSVTATISVGGNPKGIAVNAATNQAIVANSKTDNVSILNLSNNTVSATLTVGTDPEGVVMNPATNLAYVTNFGSDSVSIINLTTKTVVSTLSVGSGPIGIDINRNTQRIVVANRFSNTVSLIDGYRNTVVSTLSVGAAPYGVAIHPVNNVAYITNENADSVSVIDLVSNTVTATYPVGKNPEGIALFYQYNLLFVVNAKGDQVYVINLNNPPTGTAVAVGNDPEGVAIDPDTNTAITANSKSNTLSVVDLSSATVIATILVGQGPQDVALHPTTKKLISVNYRDNTATIIDYSTRTVLATVTVGKRPKSVAIDPVLNIAVVGNEKDGTLSFIDLSTNTVSATIPAGSHPVDIDINPQTHIAVVANKKIDSVTLIDLANKLTLATLAVGKDPNAVAINSNTNTALVANQKSATLSVIDLGSKTVTATLATLPYPTGVAINPSTNIAAVASHETGTLQLIDLGTNLVLTTLFPAGNEPEDVAINPNTNVAAVSNESVFGLTIIQLPNPVPVLSSLSPVTVTAGDPGFTLTLNGSKFLKTSTVTFNNQSVLTQFVSNSQLTATIPASAMTTAGSVTVTVTNPSPGGGTSNPLTMTINNPVPVLNALSPASVIAGSGTFQLTLTGSKFLPNSTVYFNGLGLTPVFVNSTTLTVTVPAIAIAFAGNNPVTVFNPAPGGGASNVLTFVAINPAPTLTALSPGSVIAGSSSFLMTLAGTNFVTTSTVNFSGQTLTPQFISTTQLNVTVPAALLATAGNNPVIVINSGQPGGASNALNFAVNNPLPVLDSISPSAVQPGTGDHLMTLTGSGFVSSSTISFSGQIILPQSVSNLAVKDESNYVYEYKAIDWTQWIEPGTGGTLLFNGTAGMTSIPIGFNFKFYGNIQTTVTVNTSGFLSFSGVPDFGNQSLPFVPAADLIAPFWSPINFCCGVVYSKLQGTAPNRSQTIAWEGAYSSNGRVMNFEVTLYETSYDIVFQYAYIDPAANHTIGIQNKTGTTATQYSYNQNNIQNWTSLRFYNPTRLQSQLNFTLPGSLIVTPGTYPVAVVNPPPGGGISNGKMFGVVLAAPILYSVAPGQVVAQSGDSPLSVKGTNFTPSSTILIDSQPIVTQFVNTSRLNATLAASMLSTTGNYSVSVVNLDGSGISNAMTLAVINPPPVINSISPASVPQGSADFNMTLNGTGFLNNSTISLNGQSLTTFYVSSSQLVVMVPASAVAAPGALPLVVVNPSPGGGASNSGILAVTAVKAPGPIITSLSQSSGVAGTIVTINGLNFGPSQGNSTVSFNGTPAVPMSWSGTAIVTTVPQTATSGLVIVASGTTPSNGISFTVGLTPGYIYTVAGIGTSFGSSPDGFAATSVSLSPVSVAVDSQGNLFLFDDIKNGLRKIDSNGIISTLATSDQIAQGTLSINIFGIGSKLVIDSDGNLLLSTAYSQVRRIGRDGIIKRVAGIGAVVHWWNPQLDIVFAGDGGSATFAQFHDWMNGIAVDGVGNFYIADTQNHRIRKVGTNGVVQTVAGSGLPYSFTSLGVVNPNSLGGYSGDGGPATAAQLKFPQDVVVDVAGNIYIADTDNNVVRKVDATGTITTVAGTGVQGYSGDGGLATGANLNKPEKVVLDRDGNLFIADTGNNVIRKVSLNGIISTIAGSNPAGGYGGDGGPATSALLSMPTQIAVDPMGNLFIVDYVNNRIREVVGPLSQSNPPVISNISQHSGVGGEVVTITGRAFGALQGTSAVTFNGAMATSTAWSDTSITVAVPANAQSGPIQVTVGTLTSNPVYFTVAMLPIITGLSASSGTAGDLITITGKHFGESQGNSSVTFNTSWALTVSWSDTSIVAQVTSYASTGPVAVTVNGIPSNGMLFTAIPTLKSISPNPALIGDVVTFAGTNFGPDQRSANGRYTINGIEGFCYCLSRGGPWSDNGFTLLLTANTGRTGPVIFTVDNVQSNALTLYVKPVITGISQSAASVGQTVTISGQFPLYQNNTVVMFNGVPAVPTGYSATFSYETLMVQVPFGATTGPLVLSINGISSDPAYLTIAPNIFSVQPPFGLPGNQVTISGYNFGQVQGTGTITFNGVSATALVWSDTMIVAAVPSGATNGPIVVTAGGVGSNGIPFTVAAALPNPVPALASLSQTYAASGSGNLVLSLFGSNFMKGSQVNFNNQPISTGFFSDAQLIATVPASSLTTVGNYSITVINPSPGGGVSNSLSFAVINSAGPYMVINVTSPLSGSTVTQPSVTVTGTVVTNIPEYGITVNGVFAHLVGNQFTATQVPIIPGNNTLTVVSVAADGTTFQSSMALYGQPAASSIQLNTAIHSGVAPLNISLTADAFLPYPVANSTLTYSGPGVAQVAFVSTTEYNVTLNTPGPYLFTLDATDSQGKSYQDSVSVEVYSVSILDSLLRGKWNSMVNSLIQGNLNSALALVAPESQQRYQQIFSLVNGKFPAIFSRIQQLNLVSVYNQSAIYEVITREGNGKLYSYPVTFTMDKNGLWKIKQH